MLNVNTLELPTGLLIVSEDEVIIPKLSSAAQHRTAEEIDYLKKTRQVRFGTVIAEGSLDDNFFSRHPSLKGEKSLLGKKVMYLANHVNINMDIEVEHDNAKVPTPIMIDAHYITAFVKEE